MQAIRWHLLAAGLAGLPGAVGVARAGLAEAAGRAEGAPAVDGRLPRVEAAVAAGAPGLARRPRLLHALDAALELQEAPRELLQVGRHVPAVVAGEVGLRRRRGKGRERAARGGRRARARGGARARARRRRRARDARARDALESWLERELACEVVDVVPAGSSQWATFATATERLESLHLDVLEASKDPYMTFLTK